MPYTLTMATDQEPTIATDGVQEVPLTIARPLLTRLIEQAREDDQVSALTVRDRRRAYLVAPKFYERALFDRSTLFVALTLLERLPDEERAAPEVQELIKLRNQLAHNG